MIKRGCLAAVFIMLVPVFSAAEIGEGELSRYKSLFMSKIISDNPGKESSVRTCMSGMIKKGGAGTRILDRFGLFLYDSARSNLSLEMVKFSRDGSECIFMIILRDKNDNKLYNLFLLYNYNHERNTFRLAEAFFAMVYDEKIRSVTEFFGG